MHILVVEDELSLQEALVDLLEGAGHEVVAVATGELGLAKALPAGASGCPFDLVLLDLMLPGINGMEVCRRLRDAEVRAGILMLTARGDESDKVKGLKQGADDYLTKPFGMQELLARIESLARRIPSETKALQLDVDGCRIDLGRCRYERNGHGDVLTAREAGLLELLWRHRDRAVSRGELLEKVWRAPADLQTRTVDMTVAKLRQKIEADAAQPRIVVTVKGVGYAWGDSLP